jgi:GTP-binding protein HflX
VQNSAQRRADSAKPILVSAVTGEGLESLRQALEDRLALGRILFDITLDPANGEGLSWLYSHTEVLDRSSAEDGTMHLKVRVASERAEPVRRKFFESFAEVL